MESAYADVYATLYRTHWWFRSRRLLLIDELERMPGKVGRILDVGCGEGLFFADLERFGIVEGVEPGANIEQTSGGVIHNRPWDSTFESPHSFDRILFLDVLEHLDDPVDALRTARNMLTPGGRILVTVPAFRCLWTSHDDLNHHRARYNRALLSKEAGEAGLAVEKSTYFFHWVFAAKLLVRAKEAVTGPGGVPGVPSPSINRLLMRLSVAERALLSWMRLPFGSSVFAVMKIR